MDKMSRQKLLQFCYKGESVPRIRYAALGMAVLKGKTPATFWLQGFFRGKN